MKVGNKDFEHKFDKEIHKISVLFLNKAGFYCEHLEKSASEQPGAFTSFVDMKASLGRPSQVFV